MGRSLAQVVAAAVFVSWVAILQTATGDTPLMIRLGTNDSAKYGTEEGRLEVFVKGSWITVYGFLSPAAVQVACRMLDSDNSGRIINNTIYGPGSGNVSMSNVSCTGNESNIASCNYSLIANNDHSRDIAISCAYSPSFTSTEAPAMASKSVTSASSKSGSGRSQNLASGTDNNYSPNASSVQQHITSTAATPTTRPASDQTLFQVPSIGNESTSPSSSSTIKANSSSSTTPAAAAPAPSNLVSGNQSSNPDPSSNAVVYKIQSTNSPMSQSTAEGVNITTAVPAMSPSTQPIDEKSSKFSGLPSTTTATAP